MTSSQARRLNSRVTRTAARFVDHATRNNIPVSGLPAAKLPWYEIRSAAAGEREPDTATILLFDEIGGSFGVDAKSFVEELDGITAGTINLRINSPGGSVFDALTIANALRHHPARIVGYVDALAASAASFIATAADEVVMMPGSQMMIHDASAMGDGNADDMGKLATFLDRQSDNIASLYQLKGGGDVAAWRGLMLAETWMFAQEAVGFGLADRVEQVRRKLPDDAAEELLTRSFDLSQFRYAGRAAAPAPQRQTRVSRARTVERSRSMTVTDAQRLVHDRSAAAAARAAALSGAGQTRAAAPREVGAARLVPAQAQLRAKMETRGDQQMYRLEGIASVTDRAYRMWDVFGEYDEVVERRAFADTLAAGPDVAFLLNHRGMTMARTTNGTLELAMTDEGLKSVAWLNPKRQDVKDLVIAIDDETITEMSFAFMLEQGEWSEDFTEFRISQLDINRGDVSAVNYGANPYTSIAARSGEILSEIRRLPAGAARAALSQLSARDDLQPFKNSARVEDTVPVDASGDVIDNPAPTPVKPEASIAFYEALLDLT